MTHQIKDAEEITLRQILDQINILPKNKFYCFKAYIYEVENKANPWYEACSNCSKSVNKTMKTRSCNNCIDFNISIVSRYRITMSVNDGTATASVTLFGNVANVFIGCIVEDYIDSITKDGNTSIYYKLLETPNREEYTFLLKMDKSVEIKYGTLAFVIEGIQNPSTNFNNKNVASKKRSVDFEQEDIKNKRGSPTNIINDIGIQIIEDHDNTNMEIKDDEIIASPAKKDFLHKKIQKKRGRPRKESSKNKDMKMQMIDGDNTTKIVIEDDDNIASFIKKKGRMKKEKLVKDRKFQNIKEEKVDTII
ncbi:uncharacterized protein [Primulina huaijiensis]|uniref:uncharacterized protein n=1 Tax=Primulina huaijiensis TaxID=1492673 RepID=UPI003CC72D80